jgi:hypothetical protein
MSVIDFAAARQARQVPTPVPSPRARTTKAEYLRTTPDPVIASDLLAALPDLNEHDRYAAEGLTEGCNVVGKFTDAQRSYAVGLVWRAGRQAGMTSCPHCLGKGVLPSKRQG